MNEECLVLESAIQEMERKMENFNTNFGGTAIYLLGPTGSGKSSLINYLLGAKNQLKWEKKNGQIHISNPNTEQFPLIGNTSVSCTDIPATYAQPRSENILIDASGFMDTKGDQQEILNAYSNARMFKRGTKTKILLVMQMGSLDSHRGGTLPEIARRLLELFPNDFTNLINSIGIVVSKVNTDDIEENDVLQRILEISRTNQNMPIECKGMISGIVERGNVILFPMPRQIQDATVNNIARAVDNMPATILRDNAHISLDFKAKHMLMDLGRKTSDELNKLSFSIEKYLEENYVKKNYTNQQELSNQIIRLKQAGSLLANELRQDNFKQEFLEFCQLLNLPKVIEVEIISCMSKISFIGLLQVSIPVNNNFIGSIHSSLRSAISSLESKMTQIATQEQIAAMHQKHRQDIQNRQQEFRQIRAAIAEESKQRSQQIQAQLAAQEQLMNKMLEQSSARHQREMAQMTEQIRRIADRPPPQIIQQSSDNGLGGFLGILGKVAEKVVGKMFGL